MKRLVALLLTLCLLCSSVLASPLAIESIDTAEAELSAQADDNAALDSQVSYFYFTDSSGDTDGILAQPGDEFTLTLALNNASGKAYNSIALRDFICVNSETGETLSAIEFVEFGDYFPMVEDALFNVPDNDLKILTIGYMSSLSSSGELYKVKFKVSDDAQGGEYTLTATPILKLSRTDLAVEFAPFNVSVRTYVAVESVSLNKQNLSMKLGETANLTASVLPSNATNKNVSWSSSNAGVVSVSNGVVKAVGKGSATIYATAEGKTASCNVTVTVPVTGVSLDVTSTEIEVGATQRISAIVEPYNADNQNVYWSSDNEDVASVSGGVITAKKAGNAKITVTTEDGAYTAVCAVTVVAPVHVESIAFENDSEKIYVGQSKALAYKIYPENATNKNVYWDIDNTDVLRANANGEFIALKAGTATVTVKTYDGGFTDTITVNTVEAVFDFGNVTGYVGSTVKVPVTMQNTELINSIALRDFAYDSTKLEFVGFEFSPYIEENAFFKEVDTYLSTVAVGFENPEVLNGELGKAIFEIKDSAPEGTCKVRATTIVKHSAFEIPSRAVTGSIAISYIKVGDVNLDESVDIDDAIYLFQHSMMPDLYPISYPYGTDFSNNGAVDIYDAIYLFQHSMMPDLYPLDPEAPPVVPDVPENPDVPEKDDNTDNLIIPSSDYPVRSQIMNVGGKYKDVYFVWAYVNDEAQYVPVMYDEFSPNPIFNYYGEYELSYEYDGQLCSYTVDKNGIYTITSLAYATDDYGNPTSVNKNTVDVLNETDTEKQYIVSGQNIYGIQKVAGTRFKIGFEVGEDVDTNGDGVIDTFTSSERDVNIKDYTKIIIKENTYDYDTGRQETMYYVFEGSAFNYSLNKELYNVSYIVSNNPDSTSRENLVVFYGETYSELNFSYPTGPDYLRIVKSSEIGIDENGLWRNYYTVYNPMTGNIEKDVPGTSTANKASTLLSPVTSGSVLYLEGGNINDKGNSVMTSLYVYHDISYGKLNLVSEINLEEGYIQFVPYTAEIADMTCKGAVSDYVEYMSSNSSAMITDIYGNSVMAPDASGAVRPANCFKIDENTKFVVINNQNAIDLFEYGDISVVSAQKLANPSKNMLCYNSNVVTRDGVYTTQYADYVRGYISVNTLVQNGEMPVLEFMVIVAHDGDMSALDECDCAVSHK